MSDIEKRFQWAWEVISDEGGCDAPGGAEHERVHAEWIVAGRPDPAPFIRRRASTAFAPVTFERVLDWARTLGRSTPSATERWAANALANLFDTPFVPCVPPCADPGNKVVSIMDGDEPMVEFTPNEARGYAAMLLRAADEAEGRAV